MKLFSYTAQIRKVKEDFLGYISDTLVRAIANLLIPVPFAGEVATLLKVPILGFLGTLVIIMLFMLVTVGVLIFSPVLVTQSALNNLISSQANAQNLSNNSIEQTTIPTQIPLGGKGLEYAIITASFKDPGYFLQFGKVHFGIDLVPNDAYYTNNKSYLETHKVIVYSTHSGKTNYYVDEYGSETVEVENDNSTLKTVYMHMKDVYVSTGETIKAGTGLGEMGKTGFATAEHIHYEIRIKDGTNWLPVNPLIYIR